MYYTAARLRLPPDGAGSYLSPVVGPTIDLVVPPPTRRDVASSEETRLSVMPRECARLSWLFVREKGERRKMEARKEEGGGSKKKRAAAPSDRLAHDDVRGEEEDAEGRRGPGRMSPPPPHNFLFCCCLPPAALRRS